MTGKIFSLIVLSVTFCTITEVFFKKGVNNLPSDNTKSILHYIRFIKNVLLSGYIWCGFAGLLLWMATWLVVLAQVDLSLAFPLDSIQYLMILAASYLFLGERITWRRVIGTLCIVAGITLVALS